MKEHVQIGKYTYGVFDKNVIWDSEAWNYEGEKKQPKLIIGNYCSIGDYSKFYLGGNHRHDWVSTYPFQVKRLHNNIFNSIEDEINGYPLSNGDIIVGNDVWFGENVTVMSGIKIGDGAVIGTNSTVVKDVKLYSIVGGHPAKHIKYRFSDDIIEKLLQIKWWNMEDSELNLLLPYMCSDNIDYFFEEHNNLIKKI